MIDIVNQKPGTRNELSWDVTRVLTQSLYLVRTRMLRSFAEQQLKHGRGEGSCLHGVLLARCFLNYIGY